MKYEVIESEHWEHKETGRKVSLYGALPWSAGARESDKAKWLLVSSGWTVRNPLTGQIGIGKPPCKSQEQAEELANRLGKPSSMGIGD